MKNLKIYERKGEYEVLKPFIFLPKEEFKGDLTEFEVTKYLIRNNIMDSNTSNVDEVVEQFIDNEQEKRGISPDDKPNSNSDGNTSISSDTVIDNNTSVYGDTIIDDNIFPVPVVNNADTLVTSNNHVNSNMAATNYNEGYNIYHNVNGYNYMIPFGFLKNKLCMLQGGNPNYNSNAVIGIERKVPGQSNQKKGGLTALDAAEILMEKFPFINTGEALYFFKDGYYSLLTPNKAYSLMISLGYKEISEKGTINFLKDIYELLKVDPRISHSMDIDESRYLAFNNCVLDLETWQLSPNNGRFFITSKINCNYIEGEFPTPVFDKFISDCADGDPYKIAFLMEVIGYYITSDTAGKYFVVLVGAGDTGKSVLGRFIASLFNEGAVAALDINDLSKRFDTYTLVGKKINLSMDLCNGIIKEEAVSQLKKLTGNDICKAESKYENPFFFKNTCKFLFASNFPVKTRIDDIGFRNRLITIHMNNVIPKELQNKHLDAQLYAEREGIIYKTLQAYRQFKRRNYIFTGYIEAHNPYVNTVYEDELTTLRNFLEICCRFQPGKALPLSNLYGTYTSYCQQRGIPCITQQSRFTTQLKDLLRSDTDTKRVEFKKVRYGDSTLNSVIGIDINTNLPF